MQKVFLLLLLLLPLSVSATKYTPYSEYQYSTQEVKESELVEVRKEKRYKYYKNIKTYSKKYYLEKENNSIYPIKSNKYIVTDFTPYSEEKPIDKKNRIIEIKNETIYQKLKPIKYIKISNVEPKCEFVFVRNIKVNYDNIEIPYIERNRSVVKVGTDIFGLMRTKEGVIDLELDNYYDLDKLKLIITTDRTCDNTLSYDIDFYNELDEKYVSSNLAFDYTNIYRLDSIVEIKEDMIVNKIYDIYIPNENIKENWLVTSFNKILYSYQDKLYKYYKISRKYLKDYYTDKKGYQKDSNKYTTLYKYRTREEDKEKPAIIKKDSKKVVNEKHFDTFRHITCITIITSLALIIFTIYNLMPRRGE